MVDLGLLFFVYVLVVVVITLLLNIFFLEYLTLSESIFIAIYWPMLVLAFPALVLLDISDQ